MVNSKFSQTFSITNTILFLSIIFFLQLPFYFQVFPHYKIFGLPYLILILAYFINNSLKNEEGLTRLNSILYFFLFFVTFSITYSFYKNYLGREERLKEIHQIPQLVSVLRTKINEGESVFTYGHRMLYVYAGFVTPFPKTISYGFLGEECALKAIEIEKPQSFWLSSNVRINNYQQTDSVKFEFNGKNVMLTRYDR
jgi:hypothetical protein